METKTKVIIAVAAVLVAAAATTAVLIATGIVKLPGGLFGHEAVSEAQQEPQEEPAPSWEQAESSEYELVESDLAGIEQTEATASDIKEMLETLNGYKWDHPEFGEKGLNVSDGKNGKYKIEDVASKEAYTLSKGMTSWTFTKGYDATSPANTSESAAEDQRGGEAAEQAAQQAAGVDPAKTPAHPQSTTTAQPAQTEKPQPNTQTEKPRVNSSAAFNQQAAASLSSQQAKDALGEQVASKLLDDLNAYISPIGVKVASQEDVLVDVSGKTLKGNVLKFQVLATEGVNRMVVNCTYDTTNLKHAFKLLD